jgi:hypothetical protein
LSGFRTPEANYLEPKDQIMPARHLLLGCVIAAAVAGAPIVTSAAPPPAAASARVDRSSDPEAAAGDHPDAARYAQLESEAPEAADFEGGSRTVVVVGGSTLVIVLLVVLILVVL